MCSKFQSEEPERARMLGRARNRWEINIRWISERWSVRMWTILIWLRQGKVVGFCEHGNEYLGSIKGKKFLN
jgi:hypothetical protein